MKIVLTILICSLLCGALSACSTSCAVPKQQSTGQQYSVPVAKQTRLVILSNVLKGSKNDEAIYRQDAIYGHCFFISSFAGNALHAIRRKRAVNTKRKQTMLEYLFAVLTSAVGGSAAIALSASFAWGGTEYSPEPLSPVEHSTHCGVY